MTMAMLLLELLLVHAMADGFSPSSRLMAIACSCRVFLPMGPLRRFDWRQSKGDDGLRFRLLFLPPSAMALFLVNG